MQFTISTATSLSALFSAASALPQTVVHPGAPIHLTVTRYTTYCSGTDVQHKMVACAEPSLSANLVPVVRGDQVLVVQRRFVEGSYGTELWSGNYTTARVPAGTEQEFTIDVKAYGVIISSDSS
ncbi:hypothetical protein B0J14DRAFT_632076 [Halenospora varia]|nr:hypothetical protein B0J14DRAFT_632076 [Halenospora varia]